MTTPPDTRAHAPRVIQGGMGVAISNWRLANAVSRLGHLGVVSGSLLDTIFVRRLQDGDPGGHLARAARHFPVRGVSDDVWHRYFRPAGRRPGEAYRLLPMYRQVVSHARQRVTMLASFCEVWLAKEGHEGPVGINLLTKVQMPNLASLYGAMLAGVDYVIMGAGIPREIPGVLDALAAHQPARLRFDVEGGNPDDAEYLTFDPADHPREWGDAPLARPRFLAVVSSASLALTLARKSSGRVDGFVVEGPTAGGHNAPPRGALQLNARGEPVYGARDVVDLAKLRELELPFWLAGGMGTAAGLQQALDAGAAGIQVGTLFAFCDESGLAPSIKRRVLDAVARERVTVRTDPRASPTGYPFKVVEVADDGDDWTARPRHCDLGYLRVACRGEDGRLVYRCAAEPVDDYTRKGGTAEDTVERRCLCNGLAASAGFAQIRARGVSEPPLVTSGDDLLSLGAFLGDREGYAAADVVHWLTGQDAASC